VDFALNDAQAQRRAAGRALADGLGAGWTPVEVVRRARQAGILDGEVDAVADVVLLEAMAAEAAAPAVALGLHLTVVRCAPGRLAGDEVGAVALTSDRVPVLADGRLTGSAGWLAPIKGQGSAIVGARSDDDLVACLVKLDAPGATVQPLETNGLEGLPCAHLGLADTPCKTLGPPQPVMAWARLLLAAVGLGMGRRALREALVAARALERRGPGGEQTVQGLLADAATELDAAMVVVWGAAQAPRVDLADASMAKLLATEAAQRAVLRATQAVGLGSFERGHVLERLSQDVRALELFAGRTEALREAVADRVLPRATR
jgi:alkylation response protein AidB-like acyl-CoA dehydrogenase